MVDKPAAASLEDPLEPLSDDEEPKEKSQKSQPKHRIAESTLKFARGLIPAAQLAGQFELPSDSPPEIRVQLKPSVISSENEFVKQLDVSARYNQGPEDSPRGREVLKAVRSGKLDLLRSVMESFKLLPTSSVDSVSQNSCLTSAER